MTPADVVEARRQASVAFVPIGPLEWHGPHLPLGLDGMHAHEVAVAAARETGGIVVPTLFAGTETVRPPGGGPQSLAALGFADDERIVGMDFPGNPVKSVYFEESAFGVTVREVVRALKADGFALILLVNGHGAVNHQRTLRRIAAEESTANSLVLYHMAFLPSAALGPAHAAREETAIALAAWPERVRRDLLPPPGSPLRYQDHGIVDAEAFDGRPTPDFTLPPGEDPRSATAEEGEAILRAETAALVTRVAEERRPSAG